MTAELQVSLLRALNVAGHNLITMARLREIYGALGCTEITTYVQSGNVICASSRAPDDLSRLAERALSVELGNAIQVIGRTHADLERVVAADPYPDADPAHRYVVFLSAAATDKGLAALAATAADGEAFVPFGSELHLLLPAGAGRSRMAATISERVLGAVPTTRNWRTVRRLEELSRPEHGGAVR